MSRALITVRDQAGAVIGECTASCYNAAPGPCDCRACGGWNHSIGLERAEERTAHRARAIREKHEAEGHRVEVNAQLGFRLPEPAVPPPAMPQREDACMDALDTEKFEPTVLELARAIVAVWGSSPADHDGRGAAVAMKLRERLCASGAPRIAEVVLALAEALPKLVRQHTGPCLARRRADPDIDCDVHCGAGPANLILRDLAAKLDPPMVNGVDYDGEGHPLEAVLGHTAGMALKLKHVGELEGKECVEGQIVRGRIPASWLRIAVLTSGKEGARLFVLEPGPHDNAISWGPFMVKGRFQIRWQVNGARQAREQFKAFDPALAERLK